MPKERTGHSKYPLPTTQEKTLHMVNTEIRLIIFFAAEDREVLYSKKQKDRADCGSDHELLIAKFRLKLKKVGQTTRPFRYDLNQMPYDSTVKMRNRFKGLDLMDRLPDELWMEVHDTYWRQGSRPSPRKRNAKKQNGYLRSLTNTCEKKRSEKQRRK